MDTRKLVIKGLRLVGAMAILAAAATNASGAESRPGMGEIRQHDWRQMEERLRVVEEELAKEKAAKEKAVEISLLEELRRRVSINGLIEAEAFAGKGYDGENESDIVLATMDLDFHVRLNDWSKAHILLLWEEDTTTPVDVDEAVLSLDNPEKWPMYLNVGKLYVPFGVFASYMIQDPLTLELGETNESAVQFGASYNGFFGSVYAFNGGMDETGSENIINNFGASLGYGFVREIFGVNVGIDYINNLADADAVTGALNEMGITSIREYVPGIGAHLHLSHGPLTLYAEYIGAIDAFGVDELEFQGRGAEPEAWHVEVAYTRLLLGRETSFALGYQGTGEAVNLGLPRHRYMAGSSIALTDHLSWSLEYVHDEDYGMDVGGTGGDADMVTTQLAFEF